MWNRVPEPVRRCCAVLWDGGYAACPVGGCVRDLLLNRLPGDWDVATSALPEAVTALFEKTVPTGIRHGTVTVLLGGMSLEVTAFRREGGYSDGRRPDSVTFDAGLIEDLSRRDFTINAMALGPEGGVIDPFHGQEDLAARLLRCVGDPDVRFGEDALRMLRAVRFSAQLGFAIEENTLSAVRRNAAQTQTLSGERVRWEMEKILLSSRPELAALPVELGMLARFGAAAEPRDLVPLRVLPPESIPRWRAFCAITGLDITALPVERRLRRAVLHPEPSVSLALTGGDLYALGCRGGAIGTLLRVLAAHVEVRPEDNRREILEIICRDYLKEN